MSSSGLRICVVVPTRDRPGGLARCLGALRRQERSVEVVVVDDGSDEPARIAELVADHPRGRLLRGAGRGPAAARDAGARAATAEMICFTDDDCEPAPDWASLLALRIERGAAAVAGVTRNSRPADPLAEASQLIANGLSEFSMRDGGAPFAASNNLACRADVYADVPFDPTYPEPGGEDRDWCRRLATHGLELAFEPAAVVEHRQELTLGRFWRQHTGYGRGAHRYRRRHHLRGAPRPSRLQLELVRSGFRRRPAVGAAVCLAQVATASGFFAAALRRTEI